MFATRTLNSREFGECSSFSDISAGTDIAREGHVRVPRWAVGPLPFLGVALGCSGDLSPTPNTVGEGGPSHHGTGGSANAPMLWGPCDTSYFPPANLPAPLELECTDIEVPLHHGVPMGEKLSLRVAIHRSQKHPNAKAVFNLAGGPGSSAVALAGVVPKTMWRLLTEFDLIYVDQRGTGASGYLGCSDGHPNTRDEWAVCAGEHDIDPDRYSTVAAAHDLELVREALGYSEIALRGTSYGTRLALEMMRLHPESLSSVVLDGAAPPDIDIIGETLRNFDRGIAQLGADCSKDPSCTTLAPDVVSVLSKRRQQLVEAPRQILVDGKPMYETEATFLDFLNEFVSRKRYRFRIPGAASQATVGYPQLWDQMMSEAIGGAVMTAPDSYSGEYTGVTEDLTARLTLPNRLAMGDSGPASALFATILCAEWLPNSMGIADLRTIAAAQTWPSPEMLELAEACPFWGAHAARPKTRALVLSGVPALVLSGALDLNTLPAWGDHVAESLPRSTHVVLPHETHSTVWTDCGGSLAEQFILGSGDISRVDQSCVGALQKPLWL